MDIQKLVEMAAAAAKAERVEGGQQTLGYLIDMLKVIDRKMPIMWDTGHHFGNEPVTFSADEGFTSEFYSQGPTDEADSDTAHPSCYRGYYSDLTFNCSTEFEPSTVGHVLDMAIATEGKTFSGYKGGDNFMSRGSMVWGGSTSWSSTGDSAMLTQVTVVWTSGDEAACILITSSDS